MTSSRRTEKRFAHFGRTIGKPHGTWVTDSAELRKAIVLCRDCKSKFNYRRYQYYLDRRFPYCQGRCDACKQHDTQAALFIHESLLTGPGGYETRHGQSWVPR
jgi:hypothetical protein